MMTSWPASNVVPWMRWFCHHFAVFSVPIPRSSARTWAATADGARPTTEPEPCSASHARRSAFMAVVLPAPAGPTSTSSIRPDTAMRVSASDWSSPSIRPSASGLRVIFSTIVSGTVGPLTLAARSRSLSSAASWDSEVNTVELFGRNTEVPSDRRNTTGEAASSGGVNRSETSSAASATIATTASRSCMVANRQPIVCREASAMRFHRRQVERFSPTTSTTDCPSSPITSRGTSSARSNNGFPLSVTS